MYTIIIQIAAIPIWKLKKKQSNVTNTKQKQKKKYAKFVLLNYHKHYNSSSILNIPNNVCTWKPQAISVCVHARF